MVVPSSSMLARLNQRGWTRSFLSCFSAVSSSITGSTDLNPSKSLRYFSTTIYSSYFRLIQHQQQNLILPYRTQSSVRHVVVLPLCSLPAVIRPFSTSPSSASTSTRRSSNRYVPSIYPTRPQRLSPGFIRWRLERQKQAMDKLWNKHCENLKRFVEEHQKSMNVAEGEQDDELGPVDGEHLGRGRRKGLLAGHRYTPPIPEEPRLRSWLNNQRYMYQRKVNGENSSLTDERQEKLESLGYSMSPRYELWDLKYCQVKEFLETNGCFPYDLDLSELDKEGRQLYLWCQRQRRSYRLYKRKRVPRRASSVFDDNGGNAMTAEREAKLNELGFIWNIYENNWMKRYRELQIFIRNHGHTNVPFEYAGNKQLATWVSEQRYHYKKFTDGRRKSSMTPKRFKLLDSLGFEWDVFEARWMQKYQELEEFVRINGKGSLPTYQQNATLRRWIKHQRVLYRKKHDEGESNSLTDKREALLDELGFPWLKF